MASFEGSPSSSRRALLSSAAVGLPALLGGCARLRDSIVVVRGDVPDEVRARCRRAARRTLDIVDGDLDERVRVAFVPPRSDGGRDASAGEGPTDDFTREVRRAQHVGNDDGRFDSDVLAFARTLHATYDSSSRTISFVDPSAPMLSDALEAVASDDVPAPSTWYPPEPVVAHELTHAIQRDRVASIPAADRSVDARRARQAVVEGTASYVAGVYRASCRDDEYDTCSVAPISRGPVRRAPSLVASSRQQYVNGRAFVAALAANDGWDAIWRAHESPPATTLDTTFPDRFLDGGTTPTSVASPETGRDWIRIDQNRLGVSGVYAKLFALGVVSLSDSAAALPSSTTNATTYRVAYRSSLVESWVGDRFVAYGHVDDPSRVGHVWRIRLGSTTAARALARPVERAYDRRGELVDDYWRVDGRYAGVDATGDVVALWMAPDRSGIDGLRP